MSEQKDDTLFTFRFMNKTLTAVKIGNTSDQIQLGVVRETEKSNDFDLGSVFGLKEKNVFFLVSLDNPTVFKTPFFLRVFRDGTIAELTGTQFLREKENLKDFYNKASDLEKPKSELVESKKENSDFLLYLEQANKIRKLKNRTFRSYFEELKTPHGRSPRITLRNEPEVQVRKKK